MPQQEISPLKTYFDKIAEKNGNDEYRAWLHQVLDSKTEISDFVASHQKRRGKGTFVGFLMGSFNLSCCFTFKAGPDVIIRFAKPGLTALRDEKITNEVQIMEYLSQNTTIPIPCVHSWGLTAESPRQLGPFIIMDYMDGVNLETVLKQPGAKNQASMILNPEIENNVLELIYHQIADYMLQISELTFPRIGAISIDDASNLWSVTRRPLTHNRNQLATVAGYPDHQIPTRPFVRARGYLMSVADEHLTHLWTQRNIADNLETAQKRFVARHQFAKLVPEYCIDDAGPFIPFCHNIKPSNIFVDPKTLRITAVLDFGFVHTMPAQFAYDPPWWLLLNGPEMWLDRCAMEEFEEMYEPRMEQFIQVLERVEEESEQMSKQPGGQRLSARMRDSWKTGRFWFNLAARNSFQVDNVYWAALHKTSAVVEFLNDKTRAEMKAFTQTKMEQWRAYEAECTGQSSS